jgi:catechol 2,3-dioxygenase-like lactoylglutathione lyase family enzyme
MQRCLAATTFLVEDYDEAIEFFRQKLSFLLLEDTPLGAGKRWVRVAPDRVSGTCLLLAKAVGARQKASLGRQAGGRVFLFLHTDDFWHDYRSMLGRGVAFIEQPRKEAYGLVAVFEDLYGNRWDLLEPITRFASHQNGGPLT